MSDAVPNTPLLEARKALGMTQADLAIRLRSAEYPTGVSQVMVSQYERGEKMPSLGTLEALVRVLGVGGPEQIGYRLIPSERVERV